MLGFLRLAMVAIVALLIFRVWHIHASKKRHRKQQQDNHTQLVPCALCKTHLLKAHSISHRGQFYCSDEHAQQHAPK